MGRHVLAGILALLLVVSAVGAGVARGHMPPAGAITICSGHDIVTIFVDSQGERVEQRVLCPDCALKLHASAAGFAPSVSWVALPGRMVFCPPDLGARADPTALLPEARAPPPVD